MLSKVIIILFSVNVLLINSVDSNVVDVSTTSGLVRGKTIDVFGKSLDQFLGIPFAEPPLGRLRFAKPIALRKPIEGIIEATYPKHSCMQLPIYPNSPNISEDCLVLNIWSPTTLNSTNKEETNLKPVMFWIYGGSFNGGSIFDFPTHNGSLLASQDIVLVTTNYRLGPFGNLYGDTSDSPGNLNFFDQLLALKWVRNNIHLFGGDKNEITIFGVSAGSFSISAHILSPLSRGLFRRAIMESGAVFHNKNISFVNTTFALQQSKQMAKIFGCNDRYFLECLRKVDKNLINLYSFGIPWLPVDGTEFLPIFAQDAFQRSLYSQGIDLMAGVVKDEGSLVYQLTYFKDLLFFTKQDFKSAVSDTNNNLLHGIDEKRVAHFYLKNVDTNNSTAVRLAFIDYFGDVGLKCPTYFFSKLFAEKTVNKKSYFYELTYASPDSSCARQIQGVCHADDLLFVFGTPILTNSSNKLDQEFSRDVIKMWTNFAKTGNPGYNWPQFIGEGSIKVKNLNPYDLNSVLIDPFNKTCEQFWKNYFL